MPLPSDNLFPSPPRSWTGRPAVLLLRLLLVLALAAGYDMGAFLLALHSSSFYPSTDLRRGLAVIGLAAAGQVLLVIWLGSKRRYVLAGIAAASALPLLYTLLILLL